MTAALTVRVWIPDVWDVVDLPGPVDRTVAEVKAQALERALGRTDPGEYIVKYRGALITDEQVTLGALDLPDRAPMIVLPARRRPVI